MKVNVSVEEAQRLLLRRASTPAETETVNLAEALGRITGAEVKACYPLPLFDRSPLDGYAMRSEDLRGASKDKPAVLEVIEEYRAGYTPRKALVKGTASQLTTGAPLPVGADVVMRYEDIARVDAKIHVFYPLAKNSNVIFAGEDIQLDECMVKQGERVTAAHIGALAGVGVERLTVRRRVKVAIISTGDEVVDTAADLAPGKIFNSNLPTLCAAVRNLGAEPVVFASVKDEKKAIAEVLEAALAKADVVVTTGGVSVGDYDFIPGCIAAVGGDMLFQGVCLKPGSPAVAASVGNRLILGLSGNAAAASVTFQLLGVPLLKKMMGLEETLFAVTRAVLLDDFEKKSPQRRFLRGRFIIAAGQNQVALTGSQGNGAVKSSIGCNALVDIPASTGALYAGQEVCVVLTGEL